MALYFNKYFMAYALLNLYCLTSSEGTTFLLMSWISFKMMKHSKSSHYGFIFKMKLDGVCRDMFSGFWEEAYLKFFDGSSLLTPVLHATIDMTRLQLLGNILSHGFLVCSYLPVRVHFLV